MHLSRLTVCLFAVSACGWGLVLSAPQCSAQEVSAFIEPYQEIDIAGGEMGLLERVLVKEGDVVHAGQLLAQLNDDVLASTLEISKAAMESKGKLNLAKADLADQESKLRKLKALYGRGNASQVELDRAASMAEMARARLEQVSDELRLKALEIERTERQLEQLRLRTPIDGVVTEIYKDPGEFLSISEPIVVRVIALDPLMVVFPVPQEKASSMRRESRIPLLVGPTRIEATGIIEYVSPVTDAQSGTRKVKVRIDNSRKQWPCGSICRLRDVLIDDYADEDDRKTILTKRNVQSAAGASGFGPQ